MTIFSKTLSFFNQAERRRGLLVLLLVMGMALLETVGIASVMPFLAVLGNPDMIESNPILAALFAWSQGLGVKDAEGFLKVLGIGAFVLIVVSAVYRTVTHYAMNRFIEMRRHSLGLRLLQLYLRQPYEFFLNRHSSDLSKTILAEVDQLILYVIRPVYNLFAYGLVLIAVVILLVAVHPLMAVLVAGVLGLAYAGIFAGLRRRLTRLGTVRLASNKERFNAASEVFGGIKDLKLLGREETYVNRFSGPSQRLAATQAMHMTLNTVPNFLIEAIIFGALLLFSVILLDQSGGLGSQALGELLPVLGLYAFGAYRMKPAAQQIYVGIASLRFGQAAVNSLFEDFQGLTQVTGNRGENRAKLKARHEIGLRALSYSYPGSDKWVLQDLNLTIPVGSSLGLVGTTGAGKTTLVDVILGLLRPTQGAITVDGNPVTDEQLRAWQQSLGYVPQEIFLTDTTIAENIALGIPKAQIDQAQVERCARMAQIHEFIVQELPLGYQTLVGERGVRLSGGQRQRIGIARALYHEPEVLVFDEATSALDTVTEQAVMEAVDGLANQKTVILIAHRLGTVKNCDQIVLLEKGVVNGKGSYEKLVNENVNFKTMAIPIDR